MIVDEWTGCYPSSWRGIITPESFSHPAKVSSKLAERIYQHAIAEGWLHEGSRIVDPFGGIGGFAFHAMLNGMDMTLVELEPKFCGLAQANIDAWNAKYAGRLARWGTARIIQGDSRHLAQVIGAAEACISSPPYSVEALGHNRGIAGKEREASEKYIEVGISSINSADGYGQTPGQLAALPPGAPPFDGCVSSPPFMGQSATQSGELEARQGRTDTNGRYAEKIPYEKRGFLMGEEEYKQWSQTCNLGSITTSQDTFWSAAREIVAQVYQVLAPGAHAIFVVKSYVKNKTLVDFPHQWQTLCEACGFVTLHEHHALLVRHGATSIDIDGNHHEHKTESKSFFRRLAEKNGSPRIDFETVLCMVKPGGEGGGWDGAISSPPYYETTVNPGNVGNQIRNRWAQGKSVTDHNDGYGTTPGQLGSLPPGSPPDTRHGEGG